MSSKKFKKSENKKKSIKNTEDSSGSRWKVWTARIVILLLCAALVITLIPSVFF